MPFEKIRNRHNGKLHCGMAAPRPAAPYLSVPCLTRGCRIERDFRYVAASIVCGGICCGRVRGSHCRDIRRCSSRAELDGPLIVGVPEGQSGTEIFTSAREVREFLEDAERYDLFLLSMGALSHNAPDFDVDFFMVESMDMEAGPAFDSALESDATGRAGYSTTNIQVGGVDEPDFLKNDGRYIYVMAGGELIIVEAHPAESAGIVFRSDFGGRWDGGYSELLLNGDRLAVLYETVSFRSVLDRRG